MAAIIRLLRSKMTDGARGSHHGSHGSHPNSQWALGWLRSTDIVAVVQQSSSDLILKRELFELYRNSQDTGGICDGTRGRHVGTMGTVIAKRCLRLF